MVPYQHQINIAEEALAILREYGLVYLSMEERTGKTLTSILMAEDSTAKNILVVTKKKALDGWNDTLAKFKHTKNYTVTNYHQVGKVVGSFDLIILDEAHSYLSAYPKTGKIWKDVYYITKRLPIIYLSATPSAQGYQLLFNQLRLSFWTPWKYKNFYEWFRVYGVPSMVRTSYGLQETYSKCKESTYDSVSHLFISYTREELEFDHEPNDVLHYVTLDDNTRGMYNSAMKDEMLKICGELTIPLDSVMKLRTALHMLEGGVAKMGDDYIQLVNHEKIDAILKDFGDSPQLVIMYQYIAEGLKLKSRFKKALILQATSYAEGIDLSMYKHLVVYSMDFSSARHSQRRARQANKNRDSAIDVHFYLVKGGISEQVYTTVAKNKQNYIDKYFKREMI
jgi:hypothetical protein